MDTASKEVKPQIREILHYEIDRLWSETQSHSGISEQFFFKYFEEKDTGYAIKIKNCVQYSDPRNLDLTYGISPPQSFAYVE